MLDDNDQREVTPLLKPTSDPDIPTSPDHSVMVYSTKQQTQNRVVHFFKAFCIPGVAVVRHSCSIMYTTSVLCTILYVQCSF